MVPGNQEEEKKGSLPSHGNTERPRQAEVRELKLSLAVDEKVLGLQVSVQPASGKTNRNIPGTYSTKKQRAILS